MRPRAPPTHPCRPRAPASFTAISSHRRNPQGFPTLAALGELSPVHIAWTPEEKEKGEEGKKIGGAKPAPPRGPEAARGATGHREARDLDAAASSASSVRRSVFHACHLTSPFFTDICTSAHGHLGEHRTLIPFVAPDLQVVVAC
jgi:hypothetical protein